MNNYNLKGKLDQKKDIKNDFSTGRNVFTWKIIQLKPLK